MTFKTANNSNLHSALGNVDLTIDHMIVTPVKQTATVLVKGYSTILNATFIASEEENVQAPNCKLIINGLRNLGEVHTNGPLNVQVESVGQNFVVREGNVLVQLIAQSPELWYNTDIAQQERLLKVLLNPTKSKGEEFAARLHMMMELMEITIEDISLDPYILLLMPAMFSMVLSEACGNIYQIYQSLKDSTVSVSDLKDSMLAGVEQKILSILPTEFEGSPLENEVLIIGDENRDYAEDQKEDIL